MFDRDAGTLTAGNSTPLTDGASAVLLASEEWAAARDLPVLAYLSWSETAAVDFFDKKEGLLMAPAYAVPRMLARAGADACRTSICTKSTKRSPRRCCARSRRGRMTSIAARNSACRAARRDRPGKIERERQFARHRPSVRGDGRPHRRAASRRCSRNSTNRPAPRAA